MHFNLFHKYNFVDNAFDLSIFNTQTTHIKSFYTQQNGYPKSYTLGGFECGSSCS
jgi:hypothetical protein